jgi:hypothetical protein
MPQHSLKKVEREREREIFLFFSLPTHLFDRGGADAWGFGGGFGIWDLGFGIGIWDLGVSLRDV